MNTTRKGVNALLCVAMTLTASICFSQTNTSKLLVEVEAVANDKKVANGMLGFYAVNLNTGKVIGARNERKSMIPASTMKLVTTAAAMGTLGHSFCFKTELQHDGEIENGVLNGNLYLKGYGDPTLGTDQVEGVKDIYQIFDTFALQLRAKGIYKITGNVVADGSYFDYGIAGEKWQWDDIGNGYGAGASGIIVHENIYYINFQQNQDKEGKPSLIGTEPIVPDFSLTNEVKNAGAGSGDQTLVFASPYACSGNVTGTIPIGTGTFNCKGAVPDPEKFASYHLKAAFERAGIKCGSASAFRDGNFKPQKREVILTHASAPLFYVLARANTESVNLYCESLLRTMGVKIGNVGSVKEGTKAVYDFWEKSGLEMEGVFIEDGSGLSARNGLTPEFLVNVLKVAHNDKVKFKDFKSTLAIAGATGTMKSMCKGTAAEGKIYAKSGSISRVRCYAGYYTMKNGETIAFSIMANNFSCTGLEMRRKIEKIMVLIAELG